MGKITGFMELARIRRRAARRRARAQLPRVHAGARRTTKRRSRARAAWTAAFRSARPAARSRTSFRTGTTWSIATSGARRSTCCTRRTIFPEFTGRVCPAPCEAACTLNINDDPVGIKSIEHFIIDKGWDEGWVAPAAAGTKTGKRVAVIGSGPAGLACAQQLARAGHDVVVFEKDDRIGGLLRYGIPDFKMEKHLDRPPHGADGDRGRRVPAGRSRRRGCRRRDELRRVRCRRARAAAPSSRATCRCRAASSTASTSRWSFCRSRTSGRRRRPACADQILATGKHVVVIGGGDTGSDCVGTSNRQGAKSVTQFELLPQPPEHENKPLVWPYWPVKLRTSSSHEEGCERDWAVATKRFDGRGGTVEADRGAPRMAEVRGRADEDGRDPGHGIRREEPTSFCSRWASSDRCSKACWTQLGVARDARSNVRANVDDYRASVPKVFAAGDARRGQSLVVWAIREGRQCARARYYPQTLCAIICCRYKPMTCRQFLQPVLSISKPAIFVRTTCGREWGAFVAG